MQEQIERLLQEIERLKQEFLEKALVLTKRYREEMKKSISVLELIPENQKMKNWEQIVESIKSQVAELGNRFKEKMDALADEFVRKTNEKLSEGSNIFKEQVMQSIMSQITEVGDQLKEEFVASVDEFKEEMDASVDELLRKTHEELLEGSR